MKSSSSDWVSEGKWLARKSLASRIQRMCSGMLVRIDEVVVSLAWLMEQIVVRSVIVSIICPRINILVVGFESRGVSVTEVGV